LTHFHPKSNTPAHPKKGFCNRYFTDIGRFPEFHFNNLLFLTFFAGAFIAHQGRTGVAPGWSGVLIFSRV